MSKNTAVILAGAVSQGAFGAGVLSVLAEHREQIPIFRVAGASSGALNAAVYAVGIRFGTEGRAAANLVDLWRREADWSHVADWSLTEIVKRDGLATSAKIREMIGRAITGCLSENRHHVDLRLTLTTLRGDTVKLRGRDATTFEHSSEFSDSRFDESAGRSEIFQAAVGSAAFPGLFAPNEVDGVGPCIDGGAVNNAPIGWAIADPRIERVLVVSAHPSKMDPPTSFAGFALLGQLVDALINERLYRDLREATWVNDAVRKISTLDGVAPDVASRVLGALGLRHVDVVEIRPDASLGGNSFSGFGDASLRETYVEAGQAAATKVIAGLLT